VILMFSGTIAKTHRTVKKEGNKMKFSKAFAVALVLTIIFAGAFTAEAMGPGRHHHGLRWNTLLKLNLSDAQKANILSIYANYDIKTLKKNLWQAQKALRTAISQATSTDGINTAIQSNIGALQTAQASLLSARATMAFQIRAQLTPAQLQQLQLLERGK
jgi:Spy/CpxP family protein refolding chaperone